MVLKQNRQFTTRTMLLFTTLVAILLGMAIRLEIIELRWLFAVFSAYILLVLFVLAPRFMQAYMSYRKSINKLAVEKRRLESETQSRLDELARIDAHREKEKG